MASTALAATQHPALVLDTPRIRLDRDGVQDFLWPLPWADYLAARDSFMAGLAVLLRPLLEAGDEDGELLAQGEFNDCLVIPTSKEGRKAAEEEHHESE